MKPHARRLRIYLDKADRWQGRPLYQAVVEAAREEGLSGAAVFEGLFGFGFKTRPHSGRGLKLADNPPAVVEIVDSLENIERFRPRLEELVGEGLATLETVEPWIIHPK
jgi:PII-like signaling protein